jgi:hypothetical protein
VLAQDGGREALRPRRLKQGRLAQIVAAEPGVQQALGDVVLEAHHCAVGAAQWRGHPDRIAEVAGVAQQVAGGDRRGIGRGDRRIERVAVGEVHALVADRRQRRGRLRRHRMGAQAVGHEDHHVAGEGGGRQGAQKRRGQGARGGVSLQWHRHRMGTLRDRTISGRRSAPRPQHAALAHAGEGVRRAPC